MNSTGSQTPPSLSNRTPWKNALRKKLFGEIKARKELQSVISSNLELSEDHFIDITLKICEKYCTPTLFMLVKSKLQNREWKSQQGNRYSNDIKQLALNFFCMS